MNENKDIVSIPFGIRTFTFSRDGAGVKLTQSNGSPPTSFSRELTEREIEQLAHLAYNALAVIEAGRDELAEQPDAPFIDPKDFDEAVR